MVSQARSPSSRCQAWVRAGMTAVAENHRDRPRSSARESEKRTDIQFMEMRNRILPIEEHMKNLPRKVPPDWLTEYIKDTRVRLERLEVRIYDKKV